MHIRTVLGDIPPGEMGITACHEHLLWVVPEPYAGEDPDLGFDSVPAAVDELRHFKRLGGAALVEMTTAEIGRHPQGLAQISRAAGVHVIAAAGHHKAKFSAAALEGQTVEQIAARMVTEVRDGIDGTGIRAGVIKAATSAGEAAESELHVIRAAGLAYQETGAPVSTHTEAGTFAVEQARLLLEAGVRPDKLCVGHLDRGLEPRTYLELAGMGIYLGFDQIGKEKYWPDAERVRLIQDLVERGHGGQILLSGDTARKSAWYAHNPQTQGISHLLVRFSPALLQAGVSPNAIHHLLVENPASFFAF